ncbi:unnamed protein product [Blepharisma stoltei]|uniref:Uncharacterized protein n=1 Tax=Blepharisma stoltei TaxID=1481888 RepID=A0AAU9K556_9CILI|nr:unnamed protein product [Blepharisma stoltei]
METENRGDSQADKGNEGDSQTDKGNEGDSQLDKQPLKDEYSSHLKVLSDLKYSDVKKKKYHISNRDAQDCCEILCLCCLFPCQLCDGNC